MAKHPQYNINALVRDENQANAVKAKLPTITTVVGTLDSHQVLVDAAAKADVVVSTLRHRSASPDIVTTTDTITFLSRCCFIRP